MAAGRGTRRRGCPRPDAAPELARPCRASERTKGLTLSPCTNSCSAAGTHDDDEDRETPSQRAPPRGRATRAPACAQPRAEHRRPPSPRRRAGGTRRGSARGTSRPRPRTAGARVAVGDAPRLQHEHEQERVGDVGVPRFEQHRRPHRAVRETVDRERGGDEEHAALAPGQPADRGDRDRLQQQRHRQRRPRRPARETRQRCDQPEHRGAGMVPPEPAVRTDERDRATPHVAHPQIDERDVADGHVPTAPSRRDHDEYRQQRDRGQRHRQAGRRRVSRSTVVTYNGTS